MVVYLAETFDAIATGAVTPSGWSEETTIGGAQGVQYWGGDVAPAYMFGKVAKATQNAGDKYLYKAFASAAGNGARLRIRHATTNATTTRAGHYYFHSGTTLGFSILFHTDGKIYITNMAGSAVQIGTYTTGTLYDITIVLGASGAISSVTVNGSTTSSPGTMNNSLTTVNRITVSAYNAGSGAGTLYFDAAIADDQTAAPSGTLSITGTFDGKTLGCTKYGDVIMGYTTAGGLPSVWRIERSSDGGTTWADITSYALVATSASGYTIRDRRPEQGSQSAALGGSVKYRITAMNATGDQAAITTAAITLALDTPAIRIARAAMLHTIMGGSSIAADSTHGLSGEKYPANAVMAMAYAYFALGDSSYKTDATTQFNYIVSSIANADFLHVLPDDNTVIYRDFHMREIYYCAIAARLMRMAGDTATAATWITEIDKWGKAWFDKLNSGDPTPTSVTKYGWDPNNTRTGTQNRAWTANTVVALGAIWKPTADNSRTYRCTTAGTTGSSEPTWSTTASATISDGTVTWTCIGATGHISFAIYANNGTTYAGAAGTDVMDVNQLSEEAAAWALLTTDTASAFYSAGTYKTKAETRITEIMGLLQTYQVTRGAVPIGEALSGIPYNGNEQYDTTYGGFTITTAAVVYSQRPDLCHAATAIWLDRILDWLDAISSPLEPLATQHYDGSTAIGLQEVEFGQAGYLIRGRTNPRANLWNQGCLVDSQTDRWRWYDQYGAVTNSPTIGDNVQFRLFNGLAIAACALQANLTRTSSDSWAWSDTTTRSVTRGRAAADTWAWSDATSRGLTTPRGPSDTWSWSDASSGTRSAGRNASDSWSWSDGVTGQPTKPRSAADTWAWSDALARSSSSSRGPADTWAWSDSPIGGGARQAFPADTWAWADSAARSSARSRTSLDTWAWSDATSRGVVTTRSRADAWAWTDDITKGSYPRQLTDIWSWADSPTRSTYHAPQAPFHPVGGTARRLTASGGTRRRHAASGGTRP